MHSSGHYSMLISPSDDIPFELTFPYSETLLSGMFRLVNEVSLFSIECINWITHRTLQCLWSNTLSRAQLLVTNIRAWHYLRWKHLFDDHVYLKLQNYLHRTIEKIISSTLLMNTLVFLTGIGMRTLELAHILASTGMKCVPTMEYAHPFTKSIQNMGRHTNLPDRLWENLQPS